MGAGLVLSLVLSACGEGGASPDRAGSEQPSDTVIVPPGDQVFPEGIAVDERDGTAYVGSTADGTVYRAAEGQRDAEVFLEPGQDGRTAVTGMVVHTARDLLLVAGRDSGRLFAYRVSDASFVDAVELPGDGESLVNDLAVIDDQVYVTDSFRPVLFRVPLGVDGLGDPEPWLRFEGSPLPFIRGEFNLNGITTTSDARALLTVDYNTGRLFTISVGSSRGSPEVREVDLDGERLEGGDGIEVEGSRLYAVSGPDIAIVDLAPDLARGEVADRISSETWRYPTTIALRGDDILLVNSQLDMSGSDDQPTLPFTIADVPKP